MAVNGATQTPTTPQTQDSTAMGRARLADNFNTFLSLLTTQLKNQDPLSPLDSNQFTQQLVQMTGVEQQIASNDLLKQLVSNTGSGIANAVSLIGKEISAVSDNAQLANGKAEWTYKLKLDAADTKIEVINAKGAVVRTSAAAADNNKAGAHTYTWDGKDMGGNKLPDGPLHPAHHRQGLGRRRGHLDHLRRRPGHQRRAARRPDLHHRQRRQGPLGHGHQRQGTGRQQPDHAGMIRRLIPLQHRRHNAARRDGQAPLGIRRTRKPRKERNLP